ncbi:MAG: hypothetical protein LH702_27775, partial [Phormidesmis sp. CAN_BIN44]|nr:hypothetical protein [Phormidesmis sp. CAN_BIN44]
MSRPSGFAGNQITIDMLYISLPSSPIVDRFGAFNTEIQLFGSQLLMISRFKLEKSPAKRGEDGSRSSQGNEGSGISGGVK